MSFHTDTGKNYVGMPYKMYGTEFGEDGFVYESSTNIVLQYNDRGEVTISLREYREHLGELIKWVDERIEEIGK